jgi:hypothetical protein
MRPERTTLALAMLAGLAGCYPYTQASYTPPVAVQPQLLHPSDGYGGLAASAPPPPLTMRPCTIVTRQVQSSPTVGRPRIDARRHQYLRKLLPSANLPLPPVLGSRVADRLPLQVRNRVGVRRKRAVARDL